MGHRLNQVILNEGVKAQRTLKPYVVWLGTAELAAWLTVKRACGAVVPIPTLPLLLIISR